MHATNLSLVVSFLGTFALSIVQAATIQLPAFEHILTGTVVTSPSEPQSYITSPYGKRLTAAGYLGGNFTTPDGTLVANVYPNVGGDSGITDNNGVLHGEFLQLNFLWYGLLQWTCSWHYDRLQWTLE